MGTLSVRERFDSKHRVIDRGFELGPCWEWTDKPAGNGYGYLSVGGRAGRKIQAHVVAYELYVGPVPSGAQIDHLCRNTLCVRHTHLEAVTQRANLLRGDTVAARNAAKMHCPSGHPYSPENTRLERNGRKRRCRTCRRVRRRKKVAA